MSVSHNSKLRETSGHGPDLKIFVRDVADKQGKKRPILVKTWSTVKDVKDALQQHLHVPSSAQSLFFGPLLTSGGELPNHRTLHDAGIYRSGETLLLDIKGGNEAASISSLKSSAVNDICVSSSFLDLTPKSLRRTVQQSRRGFALGLKPDLVLDGSGGTYYLHDARKVRVAVFKPADEEPYAENNPRGYVRQGAGHASDSFSFGFDEVESGMRAGISPGEACVREVAAFLLDHGGFSGVPATTLAEARHPAFNTNGARLKVIEGGASVGSHSLSFSSATISPTLGLPKKVGSFQEFVNSDYSMDDLSPSKLTVDEVHKIAVLDIRLLNADRNSANLLCRRRPEDPDYIELIPIDHGYCLRTVSDISWFDWCWLDWPQMKQPLSEKTKEYILRLDIDADVRVLKERLHIRNEALDYFRASSTLLKAGVKAGLTLYDIAVMCCRNDDAGEVPSRLEVLMSMATELTNAAIENGRWHHAAATRALVEQLLPSNLPSPSPRVNSGKKSSLSTSSPAVLLFKSASSTNLSSFMSEDSENRSPRLAPPPMAQSSGSDSSSDTGDATVEQEECEEWATRVIADVSLDNEPSMIPTRLGRSNSLGSDDSGKSDDSSNLSSSPVGFWYIRPGSSSAENKDEDVTWSPHISPRTSTVGMSLSSLPSGVSPETLIPPVSHTRGSTQTASVRFDVSPVFLPPPPPPEVPDLELNPPEDDYENSMETPLALTGVKRSQSFTAFSFGGIDYAQEQAQTKSALRPSSSINDNDEKVHEYYLKFIDLLVTRETAAASARQRRALGAS
uniref:Ubiquitin-like domain-containing protein n=1 Tax=Pseudictyota dubia TaxID=2749911 RepID=A0A7R9WD71_9STRA|mmetsp:Transcript_43021/g.79798  ORF Transcript_43021/g.79798 Transcript_43021/m.79798 type:complete len:792 (+) Transcript_43021:1365-3740(+)